VWKEKYSAGFVGRYRAFDDGCESITEVMARHTPIHLVGGKGSLKQILNTNMILEFRFVDLLF
jgi:hypothetical protein